MNIWKLFKRRKRILDEEIIIRNDLRLIQKKGDVYDVISQKKNATPDTFLKKTIKAHALLLSRIVYLYLVLLRRIKNSFAPVEEVKKAQDEIRDYLGLPVDLYRTKSIYVKEKNKTVGLLYGDYHAAIDGKTHRPAREDLIKNLKRIEDFCTKFDINEIYIDEFFLRRYLGKEFLSNFKNIYHSEIMSHKDSDVKDFLQIGVNIYGLKLIIMQLENNIFDNEYIYTFKDKIDDQIVKDAIDTFKSNNDVAELLRSVKARLNLHINDEGTTRDRVYGKIYQTYELGDTFLRVSVSDSNGNLISRNIITLYNYLEARDFSDLEEKANASFDNKEINYIALLYLHLLGERPRKDLISEEPYSLYDYIYSKYKATKHNKKIPWIKTRLQKLAAEAEQFVIAFFSVILAIVMAFLLRFIPNHLPFLNGFIDNYNSFLDNVESTYGKSYEMEKNLFGRFRQMIEKFFPKDMQEEILNYAQDEMEYENQGGPKKVAEIEWFTDDERPLYFMNQYADIAYYYHGELEFGLRDATATFSRIKDCEPLFQIKVPIDKSEFKKIDENSSFRLPLEACPVGNDYTLTKIIIKDEADETKCIVIDEQWYHYSLWDLSQEEKEIFKSMEYPMAYFIYGEMENVSQISSQYRMDDPYYKKDFSDRQVRDAIIRGLGLDEDATDEEINAAIALKDFTKHPLYTPTMMTDELEFLEKIASLDSIDINLAAILTTMANDGFVYTVGYKNADNDEYLFTDEAYIWAMNEDGEVIDFLEYFQTEVSESSSLESEKEEQSEDEDWATDQEKNKDMEFDKAKDDDEKAKEQAEEEEKEWASKNKSAKIKEVLKKVQLWAREHHVPYYVAAIIAVMIIYNMFGRKIQLKLQFKNAYKTLEDENLASTYAELLEFIYGKECSPREREASEMIELIDKQFQALDDEKIDALLDQLKSVIKESNKEDRVVLKRVEKLLRTIPFIKEKKNILSLRYKIIEEVKKELQ